MISDLRFAFRLLLKAPAFTLAVLGTVALGIGANTAIFTVIQTVLLHQLPYPDADRIINISRQAGTHVSVPMFTFWEQNNPGFIDLTAYQAGTALSFTLGDKAESVEAIKTSQEYFYLFGANPILGRTFTKTEDRPGGPRVAVISHALWQRRFNGDQSIIGKAFTVAGTPYAVIGVLPRTFYPYPAADIWMPLQADIDSTDQAHILTVAARIPTNITISEAHSRMALVAARYAQAHREQLGNDDKVEVVSMRQRVTGDIRPSLLILMCAVGLVLLIACANVANLLLSRAAVRQKELAIRMAIGASRGRIVRQLLIESLLLALTGGALGLILGSWGVRALLVLTPTDMPRVHEMAAVPALDPWITGFALLLSVCTGILFGLFPAIRVSRAATRRIALKRERRSHGALIAVEMAIAVVLLCGAVLLIRSLLNLQHVPLGFDPQNLVAVEVTLAGQPNYSKSSEVDRLVRELVDRLQRMPGVESAAVASALPLFGQVDMIFSIPGRPVEADHKFNGDVQWRFISPDYFEVLKTQLLSGRFFSEREPNRVVVINQAMARQFWPNADPVGQVISIGQGLGPAFEQGLTEIVGIVSDERVRLGENSVPMMYQVPSQIADASMALMNGLQQIAVLVRARPGVSLMSVRQAVEEEIFRIVQEPIGKVRTMNQARFDSTARENFNVFLLALFAAIALLLAAIGVYAVTAHYVAQRAREIGIRAALGANRLAIVRFVWIQASGVTLLGAVIGAVASFWIAPVLGAQLYGVKPSDPLTFVLVPLILLTVSSAAAGIPALRASRADVILALRHE